MQKNSIFARAKSGLKEILSGIYYFGFICKKSFYLKGISTPYKTSGAKVVSIGNISTGGCGKTPSAYQIAKEMLEKGIKVGIVLRGYGGSLKSGICTVLKDLKINSTPEIAGDESYLLAKKLEKFNNAVVVCGKKRPDAVKKCEELECSMIILDDGLQRWDTSRNVNIILVDYTALDSRQQLIPFGRLREFSCEALKRADIVLLTRAEFASTELELKTRLSVFKKYCRHVYPVYFGIKEIKPFMTWMNNGKEVTTLKKLDDVGVLCAIGNPDSFINSIKDCGLVIIKKFIFSDHKDLSSEKLREILDEAEDLDLFITEKDAVKLQKYADMIQYSGTRFQVVIQKTVMEGVSKCVKKLLI